jgi:RNA polymerase sigma-70 factor (ECF subfamily)
MQEPLDAWFKREVLPHEAALQRYLARVWPRNHEIEDLRQETYARVYTAALVSRPTSPRSFLFTTAQHLMIDRVRHERVVSIEAVGDIEALNVLVDEIPVERRIDARQELRLLARALDLLPRKCREVLWLRRVEGLSQREVAERLDVGEKTVEHHVSKGSRLLADYMLSGKANRSARQRAMSLLENDSEHGKL